MSWVGRLIARVIGVGMIVASAAWFAVAAVATNPQAQLFVPWGVAYLFFGLLLLFAARKFEE